MKQGKQYEQVDIFFQKMHKHTSNGMEPVHALAKGAYIVLIAMILWLPFGGENMSTILVCMIGIFAWPVWIYLSGYLYVNENGKMRSIYEKLKYIPVDTKVIRRVHMGYLLRFLKAPLLVAIIAQLAGAWLCNHEITIVNILYPVVVMGVFPLFIGWADICYPRTGRR